MSLINQMLQDLEKRQSGSDGAPLSTVRAVPRHRRVRFFWPLMLLLTLAAGVLAWQLWQASLPRQAAPLPASAAPTPAPDKPMAVAAEPSPAPAPEPPASTEASPSAAAEPAQPPKAPPLETPAPKPALADARALIAPGLKESTELSRLPRAAPTIAKPPVPQVAVTPQQQPPAAAPKAEPASQALSSSPVLTAPVVVTKHVRELTPQQRAEVEYRKALALVQQGRVTEAIGSLTQVVQLDATHAAARQALIGLLVEARRFGEAEQRLQDGLNLDRAQPEMAMTLARLQVERGDTDAAISTLERTQSNALDRADYQAFMAALLQREGRHREAIDHYRQALRRTSSAVWQMGLGISLQAENRYPEAREAFSRAKAANALSPELQAFVEQRLRQLGQ